MNNIKDYIQEKLVINKYSKLANHEFVFKPTENNEYAQAINNLKISLPFNIIVNDHSVTSITKINLITEYENDSWQFYDNDDQIVLELTNKGVMKLLVNFNELNVRYYGEGCEHIVVDKDTLEVIKECINEKLIINKDSKLAPERKYSVDEVIEYLNFMTENISSAATWEQDKFYDKYWGHHVDEYNKEYNLTKDNYFASDLVTSKTVNKIMEEFIDNKGVLNLINSLQATSGATPLSIIKLIYDYTKDPGIKKYFNSK